MLPAWCFSEVPGSFESDARLFFFFFFFGKSFVTCEGCAKKRQRAMLNQKLFGVCVCMKKKGEKRRALPIPFSLPGPLALLMIFKCNRLKVCRLRRFCRWKCRTIASSLLDFDTAVSLFFFLCGIFPKVLTDRTIFTVFPLTISFGSQKEGKEISVHLYVYVWLSGNFDWTNDAVFTLSDSTQTDKEENKLFFFFFFYYILIDWLECYRT